MRNRTQHGLSRLTAISDAGSTPAASTNSLEAALATRSFAALRNEPRPFARPFICSSGKYGCREYPSLCTEVKVTAVVLCTADSQSR
jgi:hypothetical protein